jgi:hypothetical protein
LDIVARKIVFSIRNSLPVRGRHMVPRLFTRARCRCSTECTLASA